MGAEGPFSKQNVANVGTAKVVQVLGEFAGESPGLALSSNDAEHRRALGEARSGTSGTGDALFRGISVTWDGETTTHSPGGAELECWVALDATEGNDRARAGNNTRERENGCVLCHPLRGRSSPTQVNKNSLENYLSIHRATSNEHPATRTPNPTQSDALNEITKTEHEETSPNEYTNSLPRIKLPRAIPASSQPHTSQKTHCFNPLRTRLHPPLLLEATPGGCRSTMAGKQRQIWGHLPFPWI